MKRIFSILILIYSLSDLYSQDVSVSAKFDSTRIYIGDQISYTVTIEKPVSYLLTIPMFRDTLITGIEILQGPLSDTSLARDGRVTIRQKYLVTSFDSGRYEVPPVYAELRTGNNIKRYFSDYSQLEVMRVKITPPDTSAKIFDIIDPYRAPLTAGELLPWILALMAVTVAAWYVYRIIKRSRQGKRAAEEAIDPDPAYIIAFRELEKLKEEQLWQKGEIKLYHTRLTDIVRHYIGRRFSIQAMELTTYETLAELKARGFRDDESFRKLKTILTCADFVKFAKYIPQPSENESNFESAWDFISSTRYDENEAEKSLQEDKKPIGIR